MSNGGSQPLSVLDVQTILHKLATHNNTALEAETPLHSGPENRAGPCSPLCIVAAKYE